MKADKEINAKGLACVNLTPEIKIAMKEILPQQVLGVFNDDPASRVGVPAWCRLTGHTLVGTQEIDTDNTLFFIRKK
ncbi:MAG: sulfurtransferase TusA family protein [Bacteroidetes bacterium]|nr:sulfurtransferase TusA family protein [Bacteroidota bacterium]